ncbi:MAG: 3-ketoacyl-ACP reductase [Spirochaetota bacterium]|nr:3-ketoacyl-ACP reductase [Spirochaetota bacterium]
MRTEYPVALVTGASRGIGRGIVLELARTGFSVAINYRSNSEAAEQTAADCRRIAQETGHEAGQAFFPVAGDIGEPEQREELVRRTLARLGRIDALINNAGVAPKERLDIAEASEESFERLMRINLQGPYFLTQAVVRYWLEDSVQPLLREGFKVVFVTSISADTVSLNRGEYCVSKAGLAMAAQLWAKRLAGEGIQVYELRPGIIETDMTGGLKEKYDTLIADGMVPQKRWGYPEDIGRAVRSILEGDLAFSTGSVLYVDGGLHIKEL